MGVASRIYKFFLTLPSVDSIQQRNICPSTDPDTAALLNPAFQEFLKPETGIFHADRLGTSVYPRNDGTRALLTWWERSQIPTCA